MEKTAMLLERKPLEISVTAEDNQIVTETGDNLLAELALRSSHILGYNDLQKRLGAKDLCDKPLGLALKKLGIEPFTKQSVTKYQEGAIEQERAKFIAGLSRPKKWLINHSKYANWIASGLFMIFFFSFLGGITLFQIHHREIGLSFLTVATFSLLGFGLVMESDPPNYRWQRFRLKGYNDHVEPFVLDRAMQIVLLEPQTELFIEKMVEVKDPFLVAKIREEEYYIDVFDEPEFESQTRP